MTPIAGIAFSHEVRRYLLPKMSAERRKTVRKHPAGDPRVRLSAMWQRVVIEVALVCDVMSRTSHPRDHVRDVDRIITWAAPTRFERNPPLAYDDGLVVCTRKRRCGTEHAAFQSFASAS